MFIRQQYRQVSNDRIGQQAHMTCRNGNSHRCYASEARGTHRRMTYDGDTLA